MSADEPATITLTRGVRLFVVAVVVAWTALVSFMAFDIGQSYERLKSRQETLRLLEDLSNTPDLDGESICT